MTRGLALKLLAVSMLFVSIPHRAHGQDTNQPLNVIRQHDRVLSPVLEVREFSGEFEQWVREVTDTAPKVEMFRWTTPASGIRSATWSVLDGPPGSSAQILQTGSAGPAPEPGSVRLFRIDFGAIDPAPSQAGGTKYWVLLEPVDSSGRAGSSSAPVEITYTQPTSSVDAGLGPGGQVVDPGVALSTSSKLGFLRDLLGQNVDLPARQVDDLESAVTAETLPEADIVLAPAAPVSTAVSPAAVPKGRPHYLTFIEANTVTGRPSSSTGTADKGRATYILEGWVQMDLNLESGAIYLLNVRAGSLVPATLRMNPRYGDRCLLDFQQQDKHFDLPESSLAPQTLLATIQRIAATPSKTCIIDLGLTATYNIDLGGKDFVWYFDSAELTKLTGP